MDPAPPVPTVTVFAPDAMFDAQEMEALKFAPLDLDATELYELFCVSDIAGFVLPPAPTTRIIELPAVLGEAKDSCKLVGVPVLTALAF